MRRPGATVFVNDDIVITRSGSSEWIVGRVSPRKRRSPYGIVLDDRKPEAVRELDEPLAPGQREGGATRVLERGDHVEERGRAGPPQVVLERVDIEAVFVDGDADRLGACTAQQDQRPVVGRRLDEHARRARAPDQQLGEEEEGLEAPVRRDDALGGDAVTRTDPGTQARMAAAAEVGERECGLGAERPVGGRAEVVDREEIGAGNAARKGDLGHRRRVAAGLRGACRATPGSARG